VAGGVIGGLLAIGIAAAAVFFVVRSMNERAEREKFAAAAKAKAAAGEPFVISNPLMGPARRKTHTGIPVPKAQSSFAHRQPAEAAAATEAAPAADAEQPAAAAAVVAEDFSEAGPEAPAPVRLAFDQVRV
jgi:hypothetical protein